MFPKNRPTNRVDLKKQSGWLNIFYFSFLLLLYVFILVGVVFFLSHCVGF